MLPIVKPVSCRQDVNRRISIFMRLENTPSRRDILKIARRLNAGGLTVLKTSPAGTTENGAYRVAALAKTGVVSAVPVGLDVFPSCPGIEMPGYSQLFLWNRTTAQMLRCAQCEHERFLTVPMSPLARPRSGPPAVNTLLSENVEEAVFKNRKARGRVSSRRKSRSPPRARCKARKASATTTGAGALR